MEGKGSKGCHLPTAKRQRSQEADGLPEEEEVGRGWGDKRKGTEKEAMKDCKEGGKKNEEEEGRKK